MFWVGQRHKLRIRDVRVHHRIYHVIRGRRNIILSEKIIFVLISNCIMQTSIIIGGNDSKDYFMMVLLGLNTYGHIGEPIIFFFQIKPRNKPFQCTSRDNCFVDIRSPQV